MSIHDFTNSLTSRIIDNQVISLEVPNGNFSLRLLGSTMPINVDVIKPGETGVTQIVIYPVLGEDGLVALCVRINHGQGAEYVPVFFRVVWKEKEGTKYPFIYLDESWVIPKRIGRATASSIEVVIKGKRFSSYKNNDMVYVPDGNLLCHYLWGTASALEVLHAAVQKKVEPIAAKRIEQLSQEVEELTQERRHNLNRIDLLQDDLSGYTELQKAVEPVCKMFGHLPTWMQPKFVSDLIKVATGK